MKIPRDYQYTAIDKINEEHEKVKSTLLCLFAGGGKTFTVACIVKQWVAKGLKVLWLAHREELIFQAKDTLEEMGVGVNEWTQKHKEKDKSKLVTTAMYLSCKELPKQWDLLVIDEYHHVSANSYKELIGTIKYKKLVGLTATPYRLDKKELEFDSIAYQRGYMELVEDGHLCAMQYNRISTNFDVELSKGAKDYTKESLGKLDNESRNSFITNIYDREKMGRTLIFMPNVNSAYAVQEEMESKGIRVAVVEQATKNRKQIIEDFKSGKYDVILNVMIFTEGTDIPCIQTVILARPTASKGLYLQMVGRGARLDEELKPDKTFQLYDLVDNDIHYGAMVQKFHREEFTEPEELEREIRETIKEELEELGHDFNSLATDYGVNPYSIVAYMQFIDYSKDRVWLPLDKEEFQALNKIRSYFYVHYNRDIENIDMILSAYPFASKFFSMIKYKKMGFAMLSDVKGFDNGFILKQMYDFEFKPSIKEDANEVVQSYIVKRPDFEKIQAALEPVVNTFKSQIQSSKHISAVQKRVIANADIDFNSGVFTIKIQKTQVLTVFRINNYMKELLTKITEQEVFVSFGVK